MYVCICMYIVVINSYNSYVHKIKYNLVPMPMTSGIWVRLIVYLY